MPDIFIQVNIEGIDITRMLNHLEVTEYDDRASRARLNFIDSELVLSDVLHEGLSIEIDLGYQDAHGYVFKGIITSLRALFPVRGEPWVEITAMNNLILMSYEPITKRWWNTTLSNIVRELALEKQFLPGTIAPPVDPIFEETAPLQQIEETGLAFLYRLAATYGCKVMLTHSEGPDQLNFTATTDLIGQEPLPDTMQFNHNLLDFYVGIDSYATRINSDIVSTDPLSGDTVTFSLEHADSSDGQWTPDPERIARLGDRAAFVTALVTASAPKRASISDYWRKSPRQVGTSSRKDDNEAGTFGNAAHLLGQTGRGRATGQFQLRPQKRITVSDVGGRWSGDWYVTAARHKLNVTRNQYLTEFECSR